MNIFNDNEHGLSFTYGIVVGAILSAVLVIGVIDKSKPLPSESTKVCRDGKLYEVTHEGNITIYDRSTFMTCEETK